MSRYDIPRDFEYQNRILNVKTKIEKRKTNNEKRKANNEKRKTNNEKRKTKSEKRKTNQLHIALNYKKFIKSEIYTCVLKRLCHCVDSRDITHVLMIFILTLFRPDTNTIVHLDVC